MESNYQTANIFNDVKLETFPRHLFNLEHTVSFTCDMGMLYISLCDDVVPGDKIDNRTFGRVQLMPLATPTMQNLRCYIRYFYVPYRLLWSMWDKFITQDGFVDNPILAPYSQLSGSLLNVYHEQNRCNLFEQLGLRSRSYDENGDLHELTEGTKVQFTIFRFLAYSLIWDTYFRDENLQNTITPDPDEILPGYNQHSTFNFLNFLPVAYEKDYFTTMLPWQQKGEPVTINTELFYNNAVLPIVESERAIVNEDDLVFRFQSSSSNPPLILSRRAQDKLNDAYFSDITNGGSNLFGVLSQSTSQAIPEDLATSERNQFILSKYAAAADSVQASTSFNINDLRYANALQRYLERLALGGNRPAEFYLSMYGVKVDDLRIGQPKYLGGGSSYIHVTPVKQTAISASSPLGTLAGDGSSTPNISFNEPFYCQEFGVVLGLFYIRPEINYTQGLDKNLQLFDHLQYYNPVFAHLGEEPVYASEAVIFDGMNNTIDKSHNDPILGYQSRYAYKKNIRNYVSGDLLGDLRSWMLSRNFPADQAPVLNSDFITVQQNYDIFAVTDDTYDHFICEFTNQYSKESSMPDFSIPSL